MTRRSPDADRTLEAKKMQELIGRLARRMTDESGGTHLRALADIRAAVEACIVAEIAAMATVESADAAPTVHRVWRMTWKQIGDDLGVSAQAAHRKYRQASYR